MYFSCIVMLYGRLIAPCSCRPNNRKLMHSLAKLRLGIPYLTKFQLIHCIYMTEFLFSLLSPAWTRIEIHGYRLILKSE